MKIAYKKTEKNPMIWVLPHIQQYKIIKIWTKNTITWSDKRSEKRKNIVKITRKLDQKKSLNYIISYRLHNPFSWQQNTCTIQWVDIPLWRQLWSNEKLRKKKWLFISVSINLMDEKNIWLLIYYCFRCLRRDDYNFWWNREHNTTSQKQKTKNKNKKKNKFMYVPPSRTFHRDQADLSSLPLRQHGLNRFYFPTQEMEHWLILLRGVEPVGLT